MLSGSIELAARLLVTAKVNEQPDISGKEALTVAAVLNISAFTLPNASHTVDYRSTPYGLAYMLFIVSI